MRRITTYSLLFIVLLLLLAAAASAPAQAVAYEPGVDFWLTVLHNNDGESAVRPSPVLDADSNVIGYEGGVAYFAQVLQRARTAANLKPRGDSAGRGSLFVSSGDNFLAGPAFAASLANGVYYDAIALDALNYDAIILGNHDFDFGPDVLADFIGEGFSRPGKPPYLSANLDFSGEPALQMLVDAGVIAHSTIVNVKGEEIGIVGATTENLSFISSPRNVAINAVLPAAQAEINTLEAMGIDKIVFVSHLQDIEADISLAQSLQGVDIMVAGGGDELLADPSDPLLPSDDTGAIYGPYPIIAANADGADVPIVTTSGQYGYLGNLVVGFDEAGHVLAIDDAASRPLRVVSESIGPDGVKPNGSLYARVVAPVEAFVADLAANVIATSEVDLDGRRSSIRSKETNEGNLIADSLLWQAQELAAAYGVPQPDVALQNGGGIRNDSIVPAGPISELDTFEMLPFPNFVTVVEGVSRSQFKEILENAVSRTQPGDAAGGSGRFAQVGGFSLVYSGSGTAQVLDDDLNVLVPGTRVQTVVLNDGTPIVDGGTVVPGPDLTVATIDFLARGGDEYPFRGAPFTAVGVTYRQALSNYLQGPLAGLISATAYPEGGEGRIVELP